MPSQTSPALSLVSVRDAHAQLLRAPRCARQRAATRRRCSTSVAGPDAFGARPSWSSHSSQDADRTMLRQTSGADLASAADPNVMNAKPPGVAGFARPYAGGLGAVIAREEDEHPRFLR
jgi:hypothetical protein